MQYFAHLIFWQLACSILLIWFFDQLQPVFCSFDLLTVCMQYFVHLSCWQLACSILFIWFVDSVHAVFCSFDLLTACMQYFAHWISGDSKPSMVMHAWLYSSCNSLPFQPPSTAPCRQLEKCQNAFITNNVLLMVFGSGYFLDLCFILIVVCTYIYMLLNLLKPCWQNSFFSCFL